MKDGEESRPRMWPPPLPPPGEHASLEAMVCVSWPSPQPMSRILSPGCGSRCWRTFVVKSGTKFAAAA